MDEYNKKLSHINDLIRLSQIDGQESHMEMNFINEVADRLGVSFSDVEKLKSNELKIKFSTPTFQKQIIEQFHRLILLMGIDKLIYKEEVSFCVKLGMRMGLSYQAISEILRKTIRNPAYIMQKDELEEIFRKYSN